MFHQYQYTNQTTRARNYPRNDQYNQSMTSAVNWPYFPRWNPTKNLQDSNSYSPCNNNMVEIEYSPGSSDTSSNFMQTEALLYATEPVLMERLMEHDQKRILVIETTKNEARIDNGRGSPDVPRSKASANENNNKTSIMAASTGIFKVKPEAYSDENLPRIRTCFSLQSQQPSRAISSNPPTSVSPSISPEKRRVIEENNYHYTTSSNVPRTSQSTYTPPYKVPRVQPMAQAKSGLTYTYSSPISHAFTSKWLADNGNSSYGYSRNKASELSTANSSVPSLSRNESNFTSESHHNHQRNSTKPVNSSLLIEATHAANNRSQQNSTAGSYACQETCCTRNVCCEKGMCTYSKDLCTSACNGTTSSPRSTPPLLQRDSDSGSLGSPPLLVESQSRLVPRGIAAVSDFRRGAHIEFISTEAICSKPLVSWTAENMSAFIRATDCAEYADVFLDQDIDGKAVLLLDKDVFMRGLGLKIGPAMKLYRHIINLRTALL